MVFDLKDHIRSLISQVTEINLQNVCDEIHYHIRPEDGRDTVHTIAISIIDEAVGPGHTLVPQYHLAGVCWMIHNLCSTPSSHIAGAYPSLSLPQRLNELCEKEFVDVNRKLEDEDVAAASIVLDLVVLVGELYKLGLVEDEAIEKVYLENLRCDYEVSDDIKTEAMCLLLELVATRWDIDPTSRNIDVERYVRSLLDYVGRHDPPSELAEEIQVGSCSLMS